MKQNTKVMELELKKKRRKKKRKTFFADKAMKCLSFHFLHMLPRVSLPVCLNTSARKKGEEQQPAVANSAFGEIYKCSL